MKNSYETTKRLKCKSTNKKGPVVENIFELYCEYMFYCYSNEYMNSKMKILY